MPKKFIDFNAFIILVFFISLIILLVNLIYIDDVQDKSAIIAQFEVNPDYFAPEPAENRSYLLVLILLFPLIYFSTMIAKHVNIRYAIVINRLGSKLIIGSILLLLLLFDQAYSNYLGIYFSKSSFQMHPVVTVAFGLTTLFILIKGVRSLKIFSRTNVHYYFAGLILCLLTSADAIYGEEFLLSDYGINHHFQAYFDSIVQVYLGKKLLVDLFPQYGYYAFFYNLVFSITGLTVLKFTLLVGVIKFLTFALILLLLEKLLSNQWIAFLGFTTIIWFLRIRLQLEVMPDPYFQYFPHRMVFPTLTLFLLWELINYSFRKQKTMYNVVFSVASILAGIGILWNVETGAICYITFLAAIAFVEIISTPTSSVNRTFFRLTIKSFTSILIVFSIVYLFMMIMSGGAFHLAQLYELIEYQLLFTLVGFNTAPISSIIHPWLFISLIYIWGIYHSVKPFIFRDTEYLPDSQGFIKRAMVFSISILGIGLFAYYLSRSHDLNIIYPSWPAVMLISIWLDDLIKQLHISYIQREQPFTLRSVIAVLNFSPWTLLILPTYIFLISSILSICYNIDRYINMISYRTGTISFSLPQEMINNLTFIRDHTNPGDKIIIFSDYDSIYYLYTDNERYFIDRAWNELFTREEFSSIREMLNKPPENLVILVDSNFRYREYFDFHNFSLQSYSQGLSILRK